MGQKWGPTSQALLPIIVALQLQQAVIFKPHLPLFYLSEGCHRQDPIGLMTQSLGVGMTHSPPFWKDPELWTGMSWPLSSCLQVNQ